jgi:hypothetical protein
VTANESDRQAPGASTPPQETVDDQTRQLRDTVEERLNDYLVLMRDTARTWDRREFDSKHLIEQSTALFEYVTRDAMWWFRHAVQTAQSATDVTSSPSALRINVPIKPPQHEVTLACSGLRHAQHSEQTIPQHAIAISPNPVPPGTSSVEVSFDPFGKPAGGYVGELVQWRSGANKPEPFGDVIVYVGGNDRRF